MIIGDSKTATPVLRVGDWRIDPGCNELSRDNKVVRLEPKAIEVLVYLARQPGKVVARDELLSAVWPGVIVGDDALTQAIIKLRKALGDDAHLPSYIETISKRGYRLIAPVTEIASSHKPAGASLSRKLAFAISIGAAFLVLVGALLVSSDLGKRLPWPTGAGDKAGVTTISLPTVAVLPLSNLSGDSKRDYFSDGITEDIINALGRFSGLRVISHHSVEAFKTRPAAPLAIKNELGARYMVKGSVREADGKLRVAIELSDVEKAVVLWSDRYDGEGKDLFEIQDRIVKNIVGTLAVKVARLEQERISSKPPESLEAYDLVLRARALVMNSERVANRRARTLLAKAVELAPDYAEAWVVLSGAESQRSVDGWMEDSEEGLRRAEQYARRALAIDDPGANARAHGQLGLIYTRQGKFDQALAEANRAIELNPSDSFAFDTRGETLLWLGRIDEAIVSLEMASRFNPAGRGSVSGFNLSLAHYSLGRYSAALAVADASLVRYPGAPSLHAIRAATLAQMGNLEAAQEAAARLRRLDPFFPSTEFGSRFVNPQHHARVQEGLRKAGL